MVGHRPGSPAPLNRDRLNSLAAVTLNLFWSVKKKGEFENGLVRVIAPLASVVALALGITTAIAL